MNKLLVHYQGWGEHWLLGTLAENGRERLFEYSPEALRRALELSPLRLKLRAQAYGQLPAHQLGLPGLVADALPDGWGPAVDGPAVSATGLGPGSRLANASTGLHRQPRHGCLDV